MIREPKYLFRKSTMILWTLNMCKGQGVCITPEPYSVEQRRGLNNDSSISSQCKTPHVYQQNVNVPFPIVAPPWTSCNLPSFLVDYQELVATLVALRKAEHANHKWVCVSCHPNQLELQVFGYSSNGSMNMARWYQCNRCNQLLYYKYLYLFVWIAHCLHE